VNVQVKVPGKVMLCGEYSVLWGNPCLAMTVDRFLEVNLTAREGGAWVKSNLWDAPRNVVAGGQYSDGALQCVETGMSVFGLKNFEVSINSDLGEFGLGSSSALRLAILLAMAAWQKQSIKLPESLKWSTAKLAWELQRSGQGVASGYDVMTQLKGGILKITPNAVKWPGTIEDNPSVDKFEFLHFFAGPASAKTSAVLTPTKRWLDHNDKVDLLNKANQELLNLLTGAFHNTPNEDEWRILVASVAAQRGIFAQSPFYPVELERTLAKVPDFDERWTYKLTGAGGEDMIIVFAKDENVPEVKAALKTLGWHSLNLKPVSGGPILRGQFV
jgi:mevalonate kinase